MIGGLILAGGLSSRMGRDKALLTIDGETLLARSARVLRDAGAERVVVSGPRPGGIPDRYPRSGPLGGLASAAPSLADGRWLIVPVDMPRLHPGLLRSLLVGGARATRFAGHPLPMMLCLDDAVRAMLDTLMRQDDPRRRSPSALQAALGAHELPLDGLDTDALVNCNTPDEWNEVTA